MLTTDDNDYSSLRYLYLWGDDKCADVDLKRLLLAYLYVIKWKGGTLFPSKEELANPPQDGIYKTHLAEKDLYESLGYIFKNVLKRNDKLGSHTGRKTGYLFGLLRGALGYFSLMLAADHDCPAVAKRYCRDAEAIMEVNRVFNDPKQQLGPWRSPHCSGDENAARSAAPGANFQKPLPELVRGFIEVRVGISPTDPRCYQPKYVYSRVIQWRKPGVNPVRELQVSVQFYYYDFVPSLQYLINYNVCYYSAICPILAKTTQMLS